MNAMLMLGAGLGWWEVLMIILLVLVLFGAKNFPQLFMGLRTGIKEFLRATRQVREDLGMNPEEPERSSETSTSVSAALVVWLAQGFGLGRIPWAPGTFGSVLGLAWFAVLLLIAQWSPVSAGVLFLASIPAAVWTCEAAEIILGEHDPGSIVLDEIIALPTCFLGWVFHLWLQLGALPSLDLFFGPTTWFIALGVFLAFRFFDVVKPWPVRQSQSLPRGWGVVVDDQLAAVYVNLVVMAVHVGLQALG
jgi:phosphatidylglycerophosphatase A